MRSSFDLSEEPDGEVTEQVGKLDEVSDAKQATCGTVTFKG